MAKLKTGSSKAQQSKPALPSADARSYTHPEAQSLLRPDVGTQAQFPKPSAAFEAGEHGPIAVKVIHDQGNELLVVKNLSEAEA